MKSEWKRRRFGVELFLGAGIAAVLVLSGAAERKANMTTPGIDKDQVLSGDLVPAISDASSSMVVARIASVRLGKVRGDDADEETGKIALNVAAVIHARTLTQGSVMEVPVRRLAEPAQRVRTLFNQWNALALKQGDFLLLAVRPAGSAGVWQAVAGRQVQSVADPLVGAARQCYVIEGFEGPMPQKRDMLAGALVSDQSLLMFYALDALGRRAILGRDAGAELIARAVVVGKTQPEQKLELGGNLAGLYFFRPEAGADRTNQMVLVALAHGLVSERDHPQNCGAWATELAGALGNEFSPRREENASVRLALIRSVTTPPAAQVIQALEAVEQQLPREERPRIRELIRSWREASGAATK